MSDTEILNTPDMDKINAKYLQQQYHTQQRWNLLHYLFNITNWIPHFVRKRAEELLSLYEAEDRMENMAEADECRQRENNV